MENKTQSLLSNKLLLESAVHGTAFTKRIHHWAWKRGFAQVLGERFYRQRCSSLTTCVNQFSAQTKLSPLSQNAALEVRLFVCLEGCFYFLFLLFLILETGSHSIVQISLTVTAILLSRPPKCWSFRHESPRLLSDLF